MNPSSWSSVALTLTMSRLLNVPTSHPCPFYGGVQLHRYDRLDWFTEVVMPPSMRFERSVLEVRSNEDTADSGFNTLLAVAFVFNRIIHNLMARVIVRLGDCSKLYTWYVVEINRFLSDNK